MRIFRSETNRFPRPFLLWTLATACFSLLGIGTGRVDATDLVGGEAPVLLSPEEALKKFTMADGFEISLWASEADMPLQSPCAMTFDSGFAKPPRHATGRNVTDPARREASGLGELDDDGRRDDGRRPCQGAHALRARAGLLPKRRSANEGKGLGRPPNLG